MRRAAKLGVAAEATTTIGADAAVDAVGESMHWWVEMSHLQKQYEVYSQTRISTVLTFMIGTELRVIFFLGVYLVVFMSCNLCMQPLSFRRLW